MSFSFSVKGDIAKFFTVNEKDATRLEKPIFRVERFLYIKNRMLRETSTFFQSCAEMALLVDHEKNHPKVCRKSTMLLWFEYGNSDIGKFLDWYLLAYYMQSKLSDLPKKPNTQTFASFDTVLFYHIQTSKKVYTFSGFVNRCIKLRITPKKIWFPAKRSIFNWN